MSILLRMPPQKYHMMRIRLPVEVKERLEQISYKQHKTVNRFVVETLIAELERLDKIAREKMR